MKKASLLFFASIALSLNVSAQENSIDNREKFQFGLKAGANYSNVYDSEGEEFRADGKIGFAGGVFAAIPIGKYIGIQPEALFSQKGFRGKGTVLGFDYEYKHTSNYLDIPLYFAVKPSEFITVLVGPQFSYLLSSKDVFITDFNTIEQEEEFQNDNIRKNTFSISLGADVNIQHFVISARSSWDFLNNKGDGTSSTPRYKNYWIQLTVGYKFYKRD